MPIQIEFGIKSENAASFNATRVVIARISLLLSHLLARHSLSLRESPHPSTQGAPPEVSGFTQGLDEGNTTRRTGKFSKPRKK